MSKRYRDMEKYSEKNKRRQRIKLIDAPPINSIRDLIEIGQSIKFYKNLDTIMLWRIAPYLEELDNLVGMVSLKETLFYQILYYIQGMHLRNQSNEYLHTVLMGPPGTGKCLGYDTPILMYDGSIKMVQHIQCEDRIMGDDGTPRNILSTCRGREIMYKVHQLYGDDYIVNESHILSLKLSKSPNIIHISNRCSYCVMWYNKEGSHKKIFTYEKDNQKQIKYKAKQFASTLPQKDDIIDICVKDYIVKKKDWKVAYKGYKVGINFDSVNVELDPYNLGFWLGDETKIKPQISNCHEIAKYLNKYFNELNTNINKTHTNINKTHTNYERNLNIVTDKNTFISFLENYNIWDKNHIPRHYLINDRYIRLQLLAGLLDSNGYLNKNTVFEITQNNKSLAKDIVFLARSLAFNTTMKIITKTTHIQNIFRKNDYYRILISGNTNIIPTKILSIQTNITKNHKNSLLYPIKLQRLQENNYYGFEIDGNHRFILGDFTVTHNTTVAHIIAKIYQGLGILSKSGPFKIAHRDDFIAGYLGQTALKTQKLLKSCLGGVLFIDEVYALGSGQENKDSFSKEAIDTLCSFLSEHTNDFCCIAAGYEKDIHKCFFAVNSGLESRFQWKHIIEEYTSTELAEIFINKVKEMKWELGINKNVITDVINTEKNMFKNAGRDIVNFISKCKIVHARRVISLDKEHKFVLIRKDLENGLEMMKNTKKIVDTDTPWGMYT